MTKSKLKVGDRVRISRPMLKQYPARAKTLGVGTVVKIVILLRPDYYGYHVKFPANEKVVLLGRDALTKVRGK